MATAVKAIDLLKAGLRGPELVDVPATHFLMVDGRGAPEGVEYADAIQALYALSYGARFALKPMGVNFKVRPLEGLWGSSAADMAAPRAEWSWTAMIEQPPEVTPDLVERLRAEAMKKRPSGALRAARLERFDEGLCAQVLHIGPYSAEVPTIERLHEFIADQGYRPRGRHHEIYLGDPRRSAPETLKTLIRQPVS